MQENVTFRVLVQHQSIKCNDFGSQLIGVQNVDEGTKKERKFTQAMNIFEVPG